MSDQSELALRAIESFNQGGSEDFIRFLEAEAHPDFVFHIQEDIPNGGEWKGIEGTRAMLRDWLETWDEFEVIPGEVVQGEGGRILINVEQRAVSAGTGMELTGPFQYVWVVDDGRISEIHLFADPEQAKGVAGVGP